jgi:hypothetical protein
MIAEWSLSPTSWVSSISTPTRLGVPASEREHVVGHVQADGAAVRPDAASREQDVQPAAGAEIEHGFAGLQLGDDQGVTAR